MHTHISVLLYVMLKGFGVSTLPLTQLFWFSKCNSIIGYCWWRVLNTLHILQTHVGYCQKTSRYKGTGTGLAWMQPVFPLYIVDIGYEYDCCLLLAHIKTFTTRQGERIAAHSSCVMFCFSLLNGRMRVAFVGCTLLDSSMVGLVGSAQKPYWFDNCCL